MSSEAYRVKLVLSFTILSYKHCRISNQASLLSSVFPSLIIEAGRANYKTVVQASQTAKIPYKSEISGKYCLFAIRGIVVCATEVDEMSFNFLARQTQKTY